jgi:RNA polymerase sigma-70 factor, ECF subfamily
MRLAPPRAPAEHARVSDSALPSATPATPATRPGGADTTDAGAVTQWLAQLGHSAVAAEQAYALLYQPLKRLARSHMRREHADHTLSATALVHEAWLRLSEQTRTQWRDRGHFMAIASTMMRRILVDHALARRAAKRDAAFDDDAGAQLDEQPARTDHDVVAVHDALLALEVHDPRAAKVVELRFFGGFELEEVAEALGISLATVKRDWTLARAWLRREMGAAGSTTPETTTPKR